MRKLTSISLFLNLTLGGLLLLPPRVQYVDKPAYPVETEQPEEDGDLGFDLELLTPNEVVVSYTDTKKRSWRMSKVDFDTMFGTIHVSPRTPDEQKRGVLVRAEQRFGQQVAKGE